MKEKDSFRLLILLVLLIASSFIIGIAVIVFLSIPESNQSGVQAPGSVICRNQSITEQELRPFLKNEFAGREKDFINAATNNGLDVILLVAIAQHETGYGTSKAVRELNNPGGIMGPGGLRRFSTLEEGLNFMAKNLYKLYISQGLTTIPQIGKKYAPVGASNDPTNLNRHWVPTVTAIANTMGGISGNCSETGGITALKQSDYGFQMPEEKVNVTSNFGFRNLKGSPDFHHGIDLAQGEGTPILAAYSGTVEVAQFGVKGSGFGGYGNVVVINHHNGFWTLYGHLSKINVKVGDQVQRGQVIGLEGNTGFSFGSHLHFEIKKSLIGGQVDPNDYLPF